MQHCRRKKQTNLGLSYAYPNPKEISGSYTIQPRKRAPSPAHQHPQPFVPNIATYHSGKVEATLAL